MTTSQMITKAPTQRLAGLDVVRGINIVAMIVYHFILPYYPEPTTPFASAIHFIGSLVAPLFFFLSGSGVRFFFDKYKPLTLFKRGVFLFLVALLVSILLKRHFYVDWNLIEDIGVAFMVMAILSWLGRYKFLAAVLIYAVLLGLFIFLDFNIEGVFPIYPMAIYFLFGYGFSQLCPTGSLKTNMKPGGILCIAVIIITVLLGIAGLALLPNTRWNWYSSALLKSAGFMILYFVYVFLLNELKFDGKINEFLIRLGRLSLTLYYLQQGLLVVLLKLDFRVIIFHPIVSYLLLTFVVFVGVYLLLRFWSRFKYIGSLEWCMRKL